ncbi:hypothetical protein [Nocardia sp. NPDC049149]|uniref:hypothetical protein n=1 Tax=Nocardia sp. NPDC049149 TaxID=3364315 RepID=UPI003712CAC4
MSTPIPFGPHLTDDQLARRPDSHVGAHLEHCADCQARAAGWQNVAVAAERFSVDTVGAFRTPSFDDLLGDAVGMPWAAPTPVPKPSLSSSLLLAASLALAQRKLLPRLLLPLTVFGFIGGILLAVSTTRSGSPPTIFGLVVTLVFQLGTLAACTPRTDPRLELFATMPIRPSVVFASRLLMVLAADTVLALVTSMVASELGGTADFTDMVAGWLGPALLASAVGVVCAVWRSIAVGAVAGGVVWLLGAAGASSAGPAHRIGAIIQPLWSTSALTVAIAALLLVVAIVGMTKPRFSAAAA